MTDQFDTDHCCDIVVNINAYDKIVKFCETTLKSIAVFLTNGSNQSIITILISKRKHWFFLKSIYASTIKLTLAYFIPVNIETFKKHCQQLDTCTELM